MQHTAAGEHPNPDLARAIDDCHEGDHLAVGRHGGGCLQPFSVGEPLKLDVSVLDPPGENKGIPRFGKTDF